MLEQRMEMLSTPTSPEPRDSLEVPVINEQPLPNIDNGLSNKVKHAVFRILKKMFLVSGELLYRAEKVTTDTLCKFYF